MTADPHPLPVERVLKQDLFGRVELVRPSPESQALAVRRDTLQARWWTRPLARWLKTTEPRTACGLIAAPTCPG